MNEMNDNLNTLLELRDKLESKELAEKVSNAKIDNPAHEVEEALTTFVTTRLERLENDAQFGDLVKMHIRQRLPEFTTDQLLQLNDQISKNNNRAVEVTMPLFQGDSSGKMITEHLKDSSAQTATVAQNLYDSADRDMLQAVSYLSSVMAKIGQIGNSPIMGEVDTTN